MGCVTSKKDVNDIHPHIFQVENVDELGNSHGPGRLEVNESELVLYQRDKAPIRWPLKSLRRYGYDKEYFSFEAGRRCPTGSGIYGFNCRRAEKLFNFVQAYVQVGCGEERESSQQGSTPLLQVEPYYLEPRSDSTSSSAVVSSGWGRGGRRLSLRNSSRLSSVTSSNGCTSPSTPNYINDDPFMHPLSEEPQDESVTVQGGVTGQPCYENVSIADSRMYVNVELCKSSLDSSVWSSSDAVVRRMSMDLTRPRSGTAGSIVADRLPSPQHCYANLHLGEVNTDSIERPCIPPPPTYVRQVNYAVLDLDNKAQCYVPPLSPTEVSVKPRQGYVTIDFDRTVALSQSASSSLAEGVRKTRHDTSAAIDLVTPTSSRLSTCLSE